MRSVGRRAQAVHSTPPETRGGVSPRLFSRTTWRISMLSSLARRVPSAAAALALLASLAQAQNAPSSVSQQGSTNAQLPLPYGAKDAQPVSRWTPPASAGRQLTLSDLMTWKQIRTPQLSNDARWFAYALAPNEGDAEVVIRGTAAGAKDM